MNDLSLDRRAPSRVPVDRRGDGLRHHPPGPLFGPVGLAAAAEASRRDKLITDDDALRIARFILADRPPSSSATGPKVTTSGPAT